MNLENAKNFLSTVKDHEFVLLTGEKINSLERLVYNLSVMSDKTFKHHVTPYRNDFSNWIRYVIKDVELANDLDKLKTRRSMQMKVSSRIENLNKIISKKKVGHFAKNRVSRPPKSHEHLRGPHEHINHRFVEFIYGAIFGAILMLIAMRIFGLV